MGISLKKVVENINSLLNKQNSQIIITYHNYLIEKGNSINSQVAYLKAVYYYAKYLENTNIIDVKQKHEIINYLNTKIKNDDLEKKYITTWNDYLLKLRTFYRWLYNCEDEGKGQEYWTTPDFMKIKKTEETRFLELEKKYSEKIANLTENLESKFNQIISKINLEKLGAN
jgi:hypothetical protein